MLFLRRAALKNLCHCAVLKIMKLRILCISVLITFFCILAYSFVSTELFYDSTLKGVNESLSTYMNSFDVPYSSLDESAAKEFSKQLDGVRVTFIRFPFCFLSCNLS